MSEATFKQAGKEVQDIIQAFVDPEMTKGKLTEISEAATTLWNLQGQFSTTPVKTIVMRILIGMLDETVEEYFPLEQADRPPA